MMALSGTTRNPQHFQNLTGFEFNYTSNLRVFYYKNKSEVFSVILSETKDLSLGESNVQDSLSPVGSSE